MLLAIALTVYRLIFLQLEKKEKALHAIKTEPNHKERESLQEGITDEHSVYHNVTHIPIGDTIFAMF